MPIPTPRGTRSAQPRTQQLSGARLASRRRRLRSGAPPFRGPRRRQSLPRPGVTLVWFAAAPRMSRTLCRPPRAGAGSHGPLDTGTPRRRCRRGRCARARASSGATGIDRVIRLVGWRAEVPGGLVKPWKHFRCQSHLLPRGLRRSRERPLPSRPRAGEGRRNAGWSPTVPVRGGEMKRPAGSPRERATPRAGGRQRESAPHASAKVESLCA